MGDLTDINTRDLTDTELFQLLQQWQNGSGSALNEIIEWLWEKKQAEVAKAAFHLFPRSLPGEYRKQQAMALVGTTFYEALEKLDVKVSGGKLLVESTGRQKRVKGVLRPLFVGVYSRRKLTVDGPLEWRGQNSFAALFRDMWLNRCRDEIHDKGPTMEVPDQRYDSLTGQMRDTTTRVPRLRRFAERTGEKDKDTSDKLFEDAIPDKTPDERDGLFVGEDLRKVLRQLIATSEPAVAEVGAAFLSSLEVQIRAAAVAGDRLAVDLDGEELWASVEKILAMENKGTWYQRKTRFLKELRKYVPAPPKRRNNR
jgi:hypothetical protein